MQRKKGFTLVELLVALVCAALVLSMISAAVIFLTRINNGATNESKMLFQLQTVKDYIQKNAESDLKNGIKDLAVHYVVEDGKVLHKTWSTTPNADGNFSPNAPTTIVSDSLIEKIEFDEKTETLADNTGATIWTCTITYNKGQTFVFVAYTQTKAPTQP